MCAHGPGKMKQGARSQYVSQEVKDTSGEVIVQGNENICRFQKSRLIFLYQMVGGEGKIVESMG